MKNKIISIVCYILIALIFLFGLLIFIYPLVNRALVDYNAEQTLETFRSLRETDAEYIDNNFAGNETGENINNGEDENEKDKDPAKETNNKSASSYETLYREMQRYNQKIYKEGQAGITDAWTFAQPDFNLWTYGVNDNVIGELRIPKMNCDLPLFLGASNYNMARGATQLGQTSMPIGGKNTNCVIAGHRGAAGGRFFLDIEALELGDKVYIDNLWQTLTYKVTEIKVIYPYESNEVMIQKGKDMVTLITCHPYPSNARRYAVYCERTANDEDMSANGDKGDDSANQQTSQMNKDMGDIESSKFFITLEKVLYILVPVALILLAFLLLSLNIKASKKRKRNIKD